MAAVGRIRAATLSLIVAMLAWLPAGCERGEEPPPPAAELLPEMLLPDFGLPFTFVYSCRDGTELVMRIDPEQEYLTLVVDGREIRLDPVRTPVGAHYEAEDIVFRLHDNVAVLHRHDMEPAHCLENRRLSLIEDARYRGVSVWATGSRPDWRLELGPDHILLETTHGAELHVFPMDPDPTITEQSRRYVSHNNENQIIVMIDKVECHDEISDVTYDTTVSIELNGVTLHGCGVVLH